MSTSKSLKSLNNISISRTSKRSSTWRRPYLQDAFCTDLQKGSYIAGIYSLAIAVFTLCHSVFDLYCLAESQPGKSHFGYYLISFDFVYAGNPIVRAILIAIAGLSAIIAFPLMATSFILILGLRKEHEKRFRPWLFTMGIFTGWRFVAFLFWSIANDIYFGYHIAMLVLWFLITCTNVFCLLVVFSNYQDLSEITRLEDMAQLRMGTLSSLNTHHSHSLHSVQSIHSPSPKSFGSSA
ncbi:hypothetical protein CHUAL_012819 [Chamberlinius hualienensis]